MTELAKLYAALAAAQGEFKAIEKNRSVQIAMKSGGKYAFRYADLEEILSKTRPALSKNGLALIQRMELRPEGQMLICALMHAEGGVLESTAMIPSARQLDDPKAFGAAITYFRRYMVTALLGVSADDDLDVNGQEASEAGITQQQSDLHDFEAAHLQGMRDAAMQGSEALKEAFKKLPSGALKTVFWTQHQPALKKAAAEADQQQGVQA